MLYFCISDQGHNVVADWMPDVLQFQLAISEEMTVAYVASVFAQ